MHSDSLISFPVGVVSSPFASPSHRPHPPPGRCDGEGKGDPLLRIPSEGYRAGLSQFQLSVKFELLVKGSWTAADVGHVVFQHCPDDGHQPSHDRDTGDLGAAAALDLVVPPLHPGILT